MDYLTPAAVIWVAVFILLGFIRGFWKALAAVLSLIGAYVASAYFSPALKRFFLNVFDSANLSETVTAIASATLIFVLAGLFIRLIIVLVSRSLPITHRPLNAMAGATLSGAYGVMMAVVMIWSVSFILETYPTSQPVNGAQAIPDAQATSLAESPPAVVVFSRAIMADLVEWNLRRSGASEETVRIAAAYVKEPQEVLHAVQNSVRSEEFKQVINSETVQQMIRERDAEALHKSPEFTRLMQQPAVQRLRTMVRSEEADWSDERVAQQMVDIWGGVDQIKSNPEVRLLLDDPEVQSFMRDGGRLTPSLLAKGQKLMALLAGGGDASNELGDIPELYQWNDESGQLQITEYAEIPVDKQPQAQKISL